MKSSGAASASVNMRSSAPDIASKIVTQQQLIPPIKEKPQPDQLKLSFFQKVSNFISESITDRKHHDKSPADYPRESSLTRTQQQ